MNSSHTLLGSRPCCNDHESRGTRHCTHTLDFGLCPKTHNSAFDQEVRRWHFAARIVTDKSNGDRYFFFATEHRQRDPTFDSDDSDDEDSKPDRDAVLYRMPSEGPQLFKKEENRDPALSASGAGDAGKPPVPDPERTVDSETDPDSEFDDNGEDNDPDGLLFGEAGDPEVQHHDIIPDLNLPSFKVATDVKEEPSVSIALMLLIGPNQSLAVFPGRCCVRRNKGGNGV